MKSLLAIIGSVFLIHAVCSGVQAANNMVGIHVTSPNEEEIQHAADLVNSNGGVWGYVTLVIQENDRNVKKWQGIFDSLRVHRLIPIVRLATSPQGQVWRKPTAEDVHGWVEFLNSLNWVIKDRYVVLFNEPNQAKEWGGSVQPKDFAQISLEFAKALKASQSDYVPMMGGLDNAAPHKPPSYEDAEHFLRDVRSVISPDDFHTYFGGWASHSYPSETESFRGSPLAKGKKTVQSYDWELSELGSLGYDTSLPVFITETGWDQGLPSADQDVSTAFSRVWMQDSRIKAVTPFILNYPEAPFANFSFLDKNYVKKPSYTAVQALPKQEGSPVVEERGVLALDQQTPFILAENSYYEIPFTLKNTGQAIWDIARGYTIVFDCPAVESIVPILSGIKPGQTGTAVIRLQTSNTFGQHSCELQLKKGTTILSTPFALTIEKAPSLTVSARLFPKRTTDIDHAQIQVFDQQEHIIFSQEGMITKGVLTIDSVNNLIVGRKYRIVLLVKGYLPRQTVLVATDREIKISFKDMLPLDPNGDGTLNIRDTFAFFSKDALLRFFP